MLWPVRPQLLQVLLASVEVGEVASNGDISDCENEACAIMFACTVRDRHGRLVVVIEQPGCSTSDVRSNVPFSRRGARLEFNVDGDVDDDDNDDDDDDVEDEDAGAADNGTFALAEKASLPMISKWRVTPDHPHTPRATQYRVARWSEFVLGVGLVGDDAR